TRLAALLDVRGDAYAEVHARVSTAVGEATAVESAVTALRELAREPTLVVPLGRRTYRVHVAPRATIEPRVRVLEPSALVLVTDAKVSRALGLRQRASLGGLAPDARVMLEGRGDRDKTLTNLKRIWDAALGGEIDRDALVLAVGGGVVSDLAGF